MASRVFVLVSLLCLLAASESSQRQKREVPEPGKVEEEAECLAAGGRCLLESECPEGRRSLDADCTRQKSLGVVCCHSVHRAGETRCDMLAGECRAECADDLKVPQAADCPEGQSCCVLV